MYSEYYQINTLLFIIHIDKNLINFLNKKFQNNISFVDTNKNNIIKKVKNIINNFNKNKNFINKLLKINFYDYISIINIYPIFQNNKNKKNYISNKDLKEKNLYNMYTIILGELDKKIGTILLFKYLLMYTIKIKGKPIDKKISLAVCKYFSEYKLGNKFFGFEEQPFELNNLLYRKIDEIYSSNNFDVFQLNKYLKKNPILIKDFLDKERRRY